MRRPSSVLAMFCVLAGVGTLTQAQTGKDVKGAAKKAIDAFFNSGGRSSAPASRLLANLEDRRIAESSGLAASRLHRDVLWTHNDSGGGAYLFAVDRKGRTLARYKASGAANVDWEDIAVGTGDDGKAALYIGDIGDNARTRSNLAIYRVREPSVAAGKTMMEAETAAVEKFPIRYPDRAHDAETLMVHPRTGEICIVTKASNGVSGVYSYPMPLQPNRQVTLKKIATLTFSSQFGSGRIADAERMTTGGDISPDGRRLVVRTYLASYEWRISPGKSVADALTSKPVQTLLPLTRQGEAICYRADGKALLTTSEGSLAPLYEIPMD